MAGRDPKPLVLVVDDDEIDVVVVNRALSPLAGEIDLRTAHDGQEALDLLAQRDPVPPITLVLLDLNMVGMGGFETLKMLRFMLPIDEIPPIVALTADATVETRNTALSRAAWSLPS